MANAGSSGLALTSAADAPVGVEELARLAQTLRAKLRVLKDAYSKQAAEMEALRQESEAQNRLLKELQAENAELRAQAKRWQHDPELSSGGGALAAAVSGGHPSSGDPRASAAAAAASQTVPPILGFLEDVAQSPDQQLRLLKQQLIFLNADRVELQRRVQQLSQQQDRHERQLQDKLSFRERHRELEAEYQALTVALPPTFSLRSFRHTYLCCAVALGIQTMTANRQRAGSWEVFTAKARGQNKFALITHTGRYVSVRKGGALHVGSAFVSDEADQRDDKERHVFEFVKGRLEDGKPFRIKTFLGSYLTCDSKGNLGCEDHPGRATSWYVEEQAP